MIFELNLTSEPNEIYKKIDVCIEKSQPTYVCVVNLNILVHCYKDEAYYVIVKNSLINLCDGVNVKRLYNVFSENKIKVLPGPDFFIKTVAKKKYSQFFLGGNLSVLKSLKSQIMNFNSELSPDSFYSPPFLNVDQFDYKGIASLINQKCPDIIWIGLGAPKQEIFMYRLMPYIDKGVMIGVGAAFNFYSGIKSLKRAPLILQKMRLESLYRIYQEPIRIIPRLIRSAFYFPKIFLRELNRKK